jgi:hypothetical protein
MAPDIQPVETGIQILVDFTLARSPNRVELFHQGFDRR